MNNKSDHREDFEYIKDRLESEEISIPAGLSEESFLAALPDQSEELLREYESVLPEADQDQATEVRKATVRSERTPVFRRMSAKRWTAAAACLLAVLIGSMQVYQSVTAPPDTSTESGELYTFRNQSEIKRLVSSLDKDSDLYFLDSGNGVVLEDSDIASEEAAPDMQSGGLVRSQAKSSSGTTGADHSETYRQVDEVDEADIVKTDGKYIYYVNNDREVVILSADKGKTRQVSKIGSEGVENYIHDIFLKDDTLVTVGVIYEDDEAYSGIVTYDISDRSRPEAVSVFRQTGDLVSSRMVGNYVYLVTCDRVYKSGRIVPKVMTGDRSTELDASSICCVPEPAQSSYIILTAADIASGKDAKTKTTAVFGASEDIYCNDHNLYCAVSEWSGNYQDQYTRVVRASLDGLKVKFNKSAKIRGRIDDQFSMDERDGYFRIATTSVRDGIDVNNLFVMDEKLKEAGSVTGFARNESIKAVRYFGDKAYVITYEQTDPLFIIDLSDPAKPHIEGEVKIDGFSTLLIPAGEGRLLGIGHATGDNGYGGEFEAGLKLVLFDISNPSAPKVLDSKEFKDMSSPAQDTHKAFTSNPLECWYTIPYGVYRDNEEPVLLEDEDVTDDAEASETDPQESAIEDEYTAPDYEAGVLVFGADDKLNIYDQHKLGTKYLTRSVYIDDYIYALDEEGNVSSFRFKKK